MTPVELSRTVLGAVRRAVEGGELRVAVPARAVVAPPGPGGRGDYATNIALQMARPAGREPRDVAEILRRHLRGTAGVADVEITGPGFLNIHLERATATAALVREILQRSSSGQSSVRPPCDERTSVGPPCDERPSVGPPCDERPSVGPPCDERPSDRQSSIGSLSGRQSSDEPPSGRQSSDEPPSDASSTTSPSPCRGPSPGSTTTPYGHTPTLLNQVVTLRVPYDVRAEVVADSLVRIIATQGGRAEVQHVRAGGEVDLRPVPAPEDPAPLGADAARWALLHPAAHDRPRITADHLLQRESNPLFRVRYAHARARALGRNAARLGFGAEPGEVAEAVPLTRALVEYPHALTRAAAHRAPDRLARQLVLVADGLLAFQHTVLPLGDEKPSAAHRARLALAEAAGTVLAGGLSLLGISAPDYL
ncbi:ArgS-related anticodon-binding protein NrtL [Streptomyces sp. NPDC096198]|uniref:ArgS-related anticodon-binding protein NrtL n=1 Tax=Streptomyces sp. NPDC096198 TaxID=3366080 RepID=UPI00381C6B8A